MRTYKGYEFDFPAIAKELFRVTKPGGVVVWVVGDETIKGSETGTSFRQALYFKDECGFNLHDTMIYRKNGAAYPSNEKSNRYSQVFEYMFILSKGQPKTFNLLKDKKNRWAGHESFGKTVHRERTGEIVDRGKKRIVQAFGFRDNIWEINNGAGYSTKDEIAYEHPAIFPEVLAADHIHTWSNPGDIVYDPCAGSGTVPKIADLLSRNWIASEISAEYCEIIRKRITPHLQQKKMF